METEPISINSACGLPDETSEDEPSRVRSTCNPVIEYTHELYKATESAIAALSQDPDVYQRDGSLVRIVRVAGNDKQLKAVVGTPIIRNMLQATIRDHLSRYATFQRFDVRSKEMVSMAPPGSVVAAVMEHGEYPNIRPLSGIAEAPFMRADGSICDEPGFDASTGFVLIPSIEFPKVPECPTQADANRALSELREVFEDFPFRSEADRMVTIATILTLLARPSIPGNVPLIQNDANVPGCGKGLQLDAISTIATGRVAYKMTWPSEAAELEKIIGSVAMLGARILAFDNVDSPICGAPLDKVLTCNGRDQFRVLGKSEAPTLEWNAVVIVTGNNLVTSGDTTRRVLVARTESPDENPENRDDFKHQPLLGWVSENRARLVVAALTILRAWVVAGKPQGDCKTWGSFEDWSATIPPAIMFAGGPNVLACRLADMGIESADKAALRTVIANWERLAPSGITCKSAIERLWPPEMHGHAPTDEFEELRAAIEVLAEAPAGKAPSARKLGEALRRAKGRVVGGKSLVSKNSHAGVQVWRVEGQVGPVGHFPTPRVKVSSDINTSRADEAPSRPSAPTIEADDTRKGTFDDLLS